MPHISRLMAPILLQFVFGMNHIIMLILGALSAQYILPADYVGLSTLPPGIMLLTAFMVTPLARQIILRYGNRLAFFTGIFSNVVGGALFAYALLTMNFMLLIIASVGFGVHQAFAGYLRFIAADDTNCCKKVNAIAMTVGGGTLAALIAPLFILLTRDLTLPQLYLGTFLCLTALNIVACLIPLLALKDKSAEDMQAEAVKTTRWGSFFAKKQFLPASLSGLAANGTMHFLMIITPMAMIGCGMTELDASWAMQTHILAMLIPSFIAGGLIGKIGEKLALILGFAMMSLSCLFYYVGTFDGTLLYFQCATTLLGLGWGICYITSGKLLLCCYCPCDRTGVQSANEMVINGGSAFLVLFSGVIYSIGGIEAVIITPILLMGCALFAVLLKVPAEQGQEKLAELISIEKA
ncbi:MAG: hypothetical protein AAF621_07120 [Pseudomonadota bacterium]